MQPAVFLTFCRALVTFFEVTITKHFTGFFFFRWHIHLRRLWKNFYFIKLYAETYETLLLDSHNKQNMGLQKV